MSRICIWQFSNFLLPAWKVLSPVFLGFKKWFLKGACRYFHMLQICNFFHGIIVCKKLWVYSSKFAIMLKEHVVNGTILPKLCHYNLPLNTNLSQVQAISEKRFKLIFIVFILLVLKQTIPQEKDLILSFKMTPWKWVWRYHGAATPSCPNLTFFAPADQCFLQ